MIITLSSTGSLLAPRRNCGDQYITPQIVDTGYRNSSCELGADRVHISSYLLLITIAFHT
jgi:hypothetical protein